MAHIAEAEEAVRRDPVGSTKVTDVLPATRWLLVMLAPLAALKCAQVFLAAPTPDEAYYWMWGQFPALSYHDHPPLAAWLQRIAAEIFGWKLIGLRAWTVASFAGCLWILHFWSKRLAPAGEGFRVFLGGTIAWLSIPMLMRFQSLAHQDHLLIFFGLATAHFFALFHERLETGNRAWRFFYFGCIALGLAGLSKYNAVFIGLGFAVWVILSARGRSLLASPHLWAGALLAVVIQTPVVIWNIQHGWPSFAYNLDERIGQTLYGSFGENLQSFMLASFIMVSPVFWVALARFVGGPAVMPFQPAGRFVFLTSTAVFVALCATNTTLYYWNLVAYLFVLPVVIFLLRSRVEFTVHAAYGILTAIWIVGLQVIYPAYKADGTDNRDHDISFGLDEIARIVEQEEQRLGADLIMTTDYRTASLLAFTTGRKDIAKIGPRLDQFDYWFDQAGYKGRNALVLVDADLPETQLVTQVFERVTPVRDFTIRKFGFEMHSYRLVWAENYSGEGPY